MWAAWRDRPAHRISALHRVTVTFNVNNSIPPNFEEEVEQTQQKSAEEEVRHSQWFDEVKFFNTDLCVIQT